MALISKNRGRGASRAGNPPKPAPSSAKPNPDPNRINQAVFTPGHHNLQNLDQSKKDGLLLDAIRAGDTQRVNMLLNAFADPFARTRSGIPALVLASMGGHAEIIKMLLDCGADPDTAGKKGELALNCAIESGDLDSVKALTLNIMNPADPARKDGKGDNAVHAAAKAGDKEIMWAVLESDPPLNEKNADEETAVMIAIKNWDKDIVYLLIDVRANLDVPGPEGNRAIMYALKYGEEHEDEEMAICLLMHGARVNVTNDMGIPPLFSAVASQMYCVVAKMIEKKVDTNYKTKIKFEGEWFKTKVSALEIAKSLEDELMEELLREGGATDSFWSF